MKIQRAKATLKINVLLIPEIDGCSSIKIGISFRLYEEGSPMLFILRGQSIRHREVLHAASSEFLSRIAHSIESRPPLPKR